MYSCMVYVFVLDTLSGSIQKKDMTLPVIVLDSGSTGCRCGPPGAVPAVYIPAVFAELARPVPAVNREPWNQEYHNLLFGDGVQQYGKEVPLLYERRDRNMVILQPRTGGCGRT